MRRLVIAGSSAAMLACAVGSSTVGPKPKWYDVPKLQPGMTASQACQIIGPPTRIEATAEGATYTWMYASGENVAGIGTTQVQSLALRFDADGKLIAVPRNFSYADYYR
jgi:outer membrane protein assembly factor BamE (lipoprotein component of BamABCDE complex)